MRRISSSVTIGLLANPHTPLWITRTPKPAADRSCVGRDAAATATASSAAATTAAAAAASAAAAAAAAASAAATAAPAPAPAAAAPAARRVERRRCAPGMSIVMREAHVRVAAAGHLRFAEHDVGEALELRLQHVAGRRLREQIGDQIARVQDDRGGAEAFDEISA